MTKPKFIAAKNQLVPEDGKLYVVRSQEIPDDFLSDLKEEAFENRRRRAGDGFHRVASIPAVIVEQMFREGLNVFEAPVSEVVKWLRRKGLDAFITSPKVA